MVRTQHPQSRMRGHVSISRCCTGSARGMQNAAEIPITASCTAAQVPPSNAYSVKQLQTVRPELFWLRKPDAPELGRSSEWNKYLI